MSGQIYQTLLEDLDKGEEVALITKYKSHIPNNYGNIQFLLYFHKCI